MTPGMYITTVICITIIAVAYIIFFSPTPEAKGKSKKENNTKEE